MVRNMAPTSRTSCGPSMGAQRAAFVAVVLDRRRSRDRTCRGRDGSPRCCRWRACRSAAARRRSLPAASARPSPATTAASFQPRSTTSPMPVFMPMRAGRRKLVHGVAGEEHAALAVSLGDDAAPRPDAAADPFDLERLADGAADQRVLVDRLRRLLAVAVEHHQPPHGVGRIDDADIGPQPVAVDGEEERALRLADALEQIGRAEEQMQRMAEHALPGQPDAELRRGSRWWRRRSRRDSPLRCARACRCRDRRSRR